MADTPSITHSVTSGRSAYGREAQVVRYMASLRACEHTPADRKPIDLVLVIDKSGSMSGDKMELTKETAELVAALATGDSKRAVEEAADLMYHTLVALRAEDVGVEDLIRELASRA